MIQTPRDRRNLQIANEHPDQRDAAIGYLIELDARLQAWWQVSPLLDLYGRFRRDLADRFHAGREYNGIDRYERDRDGYFREKAELFYLYRLHETVSHIEHWLHHFERRAELFDALAVIAQVTQGDLELGRGGGPRMVSDWLGRERRALGTCDDEPLPRCAPPARLLEEYECLVEAVRARFAEGHHLCRFAPVVVERIPALAACEPRSPYAFIARVEREARDVMLERGDALGYGPGRHVMERWLLPSM